MRKGKRKESEHNRFQAGTSSTYNAREAGMGHTKKGSVGGPSRRQADIKAARKHLKAYKNLLAPRCEAEALLRLLH